MKEEQARSIAEALDTTEVKATVGSIPVLFGRVWFVRLEVDDATIVFIYDAEMQN